MSAKLRIRFTKHGLVRYIGHLDVMRYFQKVMRRSGVDIAYTEGFSPHQKMSFALALGVGVESDAEYMDIEVNSFLSTEDVMAKMNAVSCEGIDITAVAVLPEGSKNAMASVSAAAYEVFYNDKDVPDLSEALERFGRAESITVIKETKKASKEIDLKEHVFSLYLSPENGSIHMMISAGSVINIKPSMVMKSLFELCGHTGFDEKKIRLKRLEIYDEEHRPLIEDKKGYISSV